MLLLSVCIFCAVLIATAAYAFIFKKADLFDPITLFLVFLGLFTLPLPINVLAGQTDFSSEFGDQSALYIGYIPFALLLSAVSLPFFLWAYYSPLCAATARRFAVPGQPGRCRFFLPFFTFDRTRAAALFICAIAFFMIWLLARSDLIGFLLLGYGSTSEIIGRGYLAIGLPWLFVGSMLFLFRYAWTKSRLDLVVFWALFGTQVLGYLILAQRHTLLDMLIIFVLFWNFAIRKIKTSRIVTMAIVGFVTLNLIGYLRASKYDSLSSFVDSLARAPAVMKDSESMFYTLTKGEFTGPFQTLPQVIRKFGSDAVPCQWGLTYVRSPLFLVPQVIWPSRPASLTNWYMEAFYGYGWAQNQGLAFYFLSEGYLNFGPIGVVLVMVAWGFMLGILDNYRKANSRNPGVVLLYSLSLAYIVGECIGGESAGLFSGLLKNYLLIAILGFWMAGGLSKPLGRSRNLSHIMMSR